MYIDRTTLIDSGHLGIDEGCHGSNTQSSSSTYPQVANRGSLLDLDWGEGGKIIVRKT
jgi:hypothetical protein